MKLYTVKKKTFSNLPGKIRKLARRSIADVNQKFFSFQGYCVWIFINCYSHSVLIIIQVYIIHYLNHFIANIIFSSWKKSVTNYLLVHSQNQEKVTDENIGTLSVEIQYTFSVGYNDYHFCILNAMQKVTRLHKLCVITPSAFRRY